MPKAHSANDPILPRIIITSPTGGSSSAPADTGETSEIDSFDPSPRPLSSLKAGEKALPTIPEVNETFPEPGKDYTTHGGETLRRIALEAYGDQSMVPALVAIYGCGADKILPADLQISLPVPAWIDSSELQDEVILKSDADRAAMANTLSNTENPNAHINDALDALSAKPTRTIDAYAPFNPAEAEPKADNPYVVVGPDNRLYYYDDPNRDDVPVEDRSGPYLPRTTVLGTEIDRELRGLKRLSTEISTQTEGDATINSERITTSVIGDPDRERSEATLNEGDREAKPTPVVVDAFKPLHSDEIDQLELDHIKDQAKLDISSIQKKAVNRGDGSSLHLEDVAKTTLSRVGTLTGEKKSTVTDTAADGSSTSTTTRNKTGIAGANITLVGSSSATTTDADGNSTTAGGGFIHAHNNLSVSGNQGETTVTEDGSTHTTAQSGTIDLTSANILATGKATTSETNADGTSTSDSVGGTLKLNKDGSLNAASADHAHTEKTADGTFSTSEAIKFDRGVIDAGVKTSSTAGNESTTHTDNIKIDTNKNTIGLTDTHAHTVKEEDGSSVGIASKNVVNVNLDDPSIKGSTANTATIINADGSKTIGRGGLSAGVTDDSMSAGLSGGATVVDTTGDTLLHDHSAGLDLSADKTTVSGKTSVSNTDKKDDGGHSKIGGSASTSVTVENGTTAFKASTGVSGENFEKNDDGGHSKIGGDTSASINVADGQAGFNAKAGLSGEKKTIEGDKTSTIGGKGSVAVDTAKRDISVSAGVSHNKNVQGRTSKAMGKVGFSLQDGVRAEASLALADSEAGSSSHATGGLHIGRDGKPALIGDIEFSNTNPETGVKTGHGVGGGISARNFDIGYRYSINRPDGHLTTAYLDVALSRDKKARGLAGINDMQATTVGDITTHAGGTGAILAGADDITIVARNNQIITQGGSILPTAFTTYGGFASFRGKQLTTVGAKVTDETSPNFGEYKVDTSRKVGGSIGGDFIHTLASVSGVPFGIGGSLAVSGDREIQYSTHLSEDRTKTLAEMQALGKLKRHLAGATLIDAPITVPDLSEPSEINVGDNIKINTRGSIDAGVFGSIALFAQAGVRFSLTGDFELTVNKPSENFIEVEYVPTRVVSAKLFTDAFIADASLSQALAAQIGQKFRFDMSTDAGRRGYQSALKGNLPGGLAISKLDPEKHNLRKIDREFAPGVERLKVSRITSRQRAAAAKAGWLFLTSGIKHARTRSSGMVSDGKTTANQKTFTHSTERRTILSGNEENGISGSLNFSTVTKGPKEYDTTFDGYTATAYFSDTKVRGDEYASHMVKLLNKDLGANLPEPAVEEAKGLRDTIYNLRSRKVEATAKFTPQDIVDIRDTDLTTVPDLAKAHGMSEGKINAFITKIKESERDVDAATHLDAFLSNNGRAGLGVLIKLAKMTNDEVLFSTESGFYEGVITDAGNYLLANALPATAGMSKKDLGLRYKQGEKLLKDVIHGIDLAADDPILDLKNNKERKEKLDNDLEGKKEAIEKTIDFTHLKPEDALSLWLTLDRGWTTNPQGRCQEKLLKDAGITLHDQKFQTVVATAVNESEGARHEVSMRTRQKLLPLFGDERTQVSAAVNRAVDENGDAEFTDLTIETRIIDEQLRWKGMNNTFVKQVNQAYGTRFHESQVAQRGEQQLILRQVMSSKDLDQIVSLPKNEVVDAIKASGIDDEKSKKYGDYLSAASDTDTLIRVIEHFIQDEGVMATGSLHRLAKMIAHEPELYVDSVSGAIKSDLTKVDTVITGNATPISDATSNKDVATRFKKVTQAQKTLENLADRVSDYPFYEDAQREELSGKLGEKTEALAKSLDLSGLGHNRAVGLFVGLDNGWTPASSYKAMDAIKRDTGLLGAHTSMARHKVYGETLRTHADHSSTFCSSRSKRHLMLNRDRLDKERVVTTFERYSDNAIKSFKVNVEILEKNVNHANFQEHFLTRIEDWFDYKVGDGDKFPHYNHDRSVTIEMEFQADDVLRLREIHGSEIDACIKGTLFSKEKIEEFLLSLRTSACGLDRGRVIAGFMNKNGLEGIGTLKALLADAHHPVTLETKNGLLDQLKSKVDATLAIYEGTKVTDDMTKKELTVRFGQLEKAEKRLEQMIEMVENDPLMKADEIETRKKEYESLHLTLRRAFNPDDLDREGRSDLIKVLENGWTTGTQYRIIEELKYRNVPE